MSITSKILDTKFKYPFTASFLDYPNAEDIAVLIFMMGCEHNCNGCQNPLFQNPDHNEQTKQFTREKLINEIKKACKKFHTTKIVLTGGDPLFVKNLDSTICILEDLRNEYEICIYTGHSILTVAQYTFIRGFKYIVCGLFDLTKAVQSKKTDDYIQLASTNQEIYDGGFFRMTDGKGRMYFNQRRTY
jgi:anaerobic ribonucleoside-triphosphate reductase activating protein